MSISDKRIIYTQDNGMIAIVCPVDNCGLTIEEIQSRSVPAGKTSYIINASEVPTDRTFRNAWTYTH